MIKQLKKRECDVKIKLTPVGARYLHFEMDIQGDHLEFSPSSAVGFQFGAVLSALYTLFSEGDDGHSEWRLREYLSDSNHVIHSTVTRVEWDNEGDVIEIVLSRDVNIDADFESDVMQIEIKNYNKSLKHYTVKTKDLCYAVAKACTEVLKEYGFYGYRYSTEYDYFNIHQLLYIKALALSNFEARELTDDGNFQFAKKSSFEKEIELLLFDL